MLFIEYKAINSMLVMVYQRQVKCLQIVEEDRYATGWLNQGVRRVTQWHNTSY